LILLTTVIEPSFLTSYKKSPETVEFQGFSLGGDKRDRTADLLNAIQALSQLSYTPKYSVRSERYLLYQKKRICQ
jgi:hypothetical protein